VSVEEEEHSITVAAGESTCAKEHSFCGAFEVTFVVSATEGHGQENTMAATSPG